MPIAKEILNMFEFTSTNTFDASICTHRKPSQGVHDSEGNVRNSGEIEYVPGNLRLEISIHNYA